VILSSFYSDINNIYKEITPCYFMGYKEITTREEFDKEVKQASGLVIVDFWATWCMPCRMLAPIFEKVSDDTQFSEVKFIKVDVDKAADLSQDMNVRGIPLVLAFKDGEKVADHTGAMNKDKLISFVNSNK